MTVRRPLVLVGMAALLASCGSGTASADYTEFCSVAMQMETVASGPHGEDPAAITDPKVMETTWAKVVTAAEQMRDQSPEELKSDITLMVSSLVDMNAIFKKHAYNLLEMAKNPDIRSDLDAISQRTGVADASKRFNDFMTKNCTPE